MKAYLFDFDGTLVDSMPAFGQMMKAVLDEGGIRYGDDIIKTVTPLGYDASAEYYMTLGLEGPKERIVARMTELALKEYTYNIEAKPNVAEVLRELKSRGHSLNVLTASPHSMLDPCLKRLGLFDLFDNVWSCTDFSTTKADPSIYRMAAKKMGVDISDLVFLDDNPGADATAKTAGAYVIGVFDESSAEYEDEMRGICDGYIRDFSDLL